jgi:hypothetical protein
LSFRNAIDRHQHDPKLGTHGIGFGEDTHHLVGSGVSGHVIVCGFPTQEQIAHTSADQVCLMAALAKGAHDFDGGVLQC